MLTLRTPHMPHTRAGPTPALSPPLPPHYGGAPRRLTARVTTSARTLGGASRDPAHAACGAWGLVGSGLKSCLPESCSSPSAC